MFSSKNKISLHELIIICCREPHLGLSPTHALVPKCPDTSAPRRHWYQSVPMSKCLGAEVFGIPNYCMSCQKTQ